MTTATNRSKARYTRAAAVTPPITLRSDDAEALRRLLADRRVGVTELIRQLIREADERRKTA